MPRKLTIVELLDAYDKVLSHVQEHPDATARDVEKATGIERHRVAELLKNGLPELRRRPINEVLRDRQVARAEIERREKELKASAALEDSERISTREVIIARNLRSSALDIAAVAHRLREYAFAKLVPRIMKIDPGALDSGECMQMLWRISRFESALASIAEASLTVERERTGEATQVIKVEHEHAIVSPDEIKAEALKVIETADRLKQLQAGDQAEMEKDKEEPGAGGTLLN